MRSKLKKKSRILSKNIFYIELYRYSHLNFQNIIDVELISNELDFLLIYMNDFKSNHLKFKEFDTIVVNEYVSNDKIINCYNMYFFENKWKFGKIESNDFLVKKIHTSYINFNNGKNKLF